VIVCFFLQIKTFDKKKMNQKKTTWIGPMTFDVASARLQYSRVLIGDDNELAVNVGDSILFKIPSPSSASASNTNGNRRSVSVSSTSTSPSNSNLGVPSSPSNPNEESPSFSSFGAARILQLWHNPRGKLERTASVQIYTHLIVPSLSEILIQQKDFLEATSDSNQNWLFSDLFFLLSRCVLKLDEAMVIVKNNNSSNNNNSNNNGNENQNSSSSLNTTGAVESNSEENNSSSSVSSSSSSLRSMINLEIPLFTVDRKAEIRELSECGACVACFLRSTTGIFDPQQQQQQRKGGNNNNSNIGTPNSKSAQSSQSLFFSQNITTSSSSSGASSPPVLVTDQQLRDLVSSYNFKATRDLFGGNNHNPSANVISALTKLKISIDERLSFILGKFMSIDRSCSNCEQQRENYLSSSSSPQRNSNQNFLNETLEVLKKDIMNRLLIPVYVVPDIASILRKQQQQEISETKNEISEIQQRKEQEKGEEETHVESPTTTTKGKRRVRIQIDEQEENGEKEEEEEKEEMKQPASSQPASPSQPSQVQAVFAFPSLAAAGIDLKFLRVEDPSMFSNYQN
jgi:hypothetical protein